VMRVQLIKLTYVSTKHKLHIFISAFAAKGDADFNY
jgi:hypothetical protein